VFPPSLDVESFMVRSLKDRLCLKEEWIKNYVEVLNEEGVNNLGQLRDFVETADESVFCKLLMPFFVKRMLWFSVVSVFPRGGKIECCVSEKKITENTQESSDVVGTYRNIHYSDIEDYNYQKGLSFLCPVSTLNYRQPMHLLPYNESFSIKDKRDLMFLDTVLIKEKKNVWKKVNWIEDPIEAYQLAETQNKPITYFCRANLFGEVDGMV